MFVNQADLWFASKKTDGILDFSFEKAVLNMVMSSI